MYRLFMTEDGLKSQLELKPHEFQGLLKVLFICQRNDEQGANLVFNIALMQGVRISELMSL